MTVNERLEELVKTYANGNVSQFAKFIGVSHTSIASMLPGSRESKPGFEIIAKITETFPEVSTDWLIKDEAPMVRGNVFTDNKIKGNANTQAGGNVNAGIDQECRQQLEEMRKERDLWKDKYIALLERHSQ